MREALWAEALEAADALLEGVFRMAVAKALDPQDPKDFLVIQHRLASAIKGLTGKAEAQAMRAALGALDVDWAKMTPAGREKVIAASRAVLAKPPPNLPQVAATFQAAGVRTVKGAKTSFVETFGAKIDASLSATDARIVAHAATSQALYVRDQYGKRADALAANARKIVADGLAKGLGRYDLAKDLRDGLAAQGVARSDAYWNMAAGVFVNRARVYGSLAGFSEAKISRFRFDAVLDEVTTLQCRFMHGRVFDVATALEKYADVAAATAPEAVTTLQPWLRVAKDANGQPALHYVDAAGARQHVATVTDNALGRLDDAGAFETAHTNDALARAGLSSPPLHGNCRSTVRPVFGSARSAARPRAAPSGAAPVAFPSAAAPSGAAPVALPATVPEQSAAATPLASLEEGVHFKALVGRGLSKSATRDLLRAVSDAGLEPLLRANPLDNLVLKKTIGGSNGTYVSRRGGAPHAELRVRTSRPPHTYGKPFVAGASWSVSSAATTSLEAMQRTLVHELAHHAHRTGGDAVDAAIKKAWAAALEKNAFVTQYAGTSAGEYFAESFAAFHFENAALRAQDPEGAKLVERVLKLALPKEKPPRGRKTTA